MSYKYYQPNKKDLKDKYDDCVVRALTKVLDKDWIEVFDDLVKYARGIQCMPSSKQCYEQYLKDNGFVYIGISNKKGQNVLQLHSFLKNIKMENIL